MKDRGLTQTALAEIMGYRQSSISMILAGTRTPRPMIPFVRRLEQVESETTPGA
jgi:transcriptional regulator with XRE-family HTH domain